MCVAGIIIRTHVWATDRDLDRIVGVYYRGAFRWRTLIKPASDCVCSRSLTLAVFFVRFVIWCRSVMKEIMTKHSFVAPGIVWISSVKENIKLS